MNAGDIIQSKREWLDQNEEYGEIKYLVLEDRGDRVLCQMLGWKYGPLVPTSVVAKEYMEVVEKSD